MSAVLALALFTLVGTAAAQPFPVTPRMVDVDGRDVRVMTAGFEHLERGRPVVVFESGGGTTLNNWGTVFTDVAAFAPVVAYDRAGIGGSVWDGEPPTPERRVAQLRALLAELDAPPPYVLVGHSWGGPLIRVFAGHHPDEVAGLVYVDPTDFSQGRAELVALIESLEPGRGEEALRESNESWRSSTAQAPPGMQAEREEAIAFGEKEVEERGLGPEPAAPLAVLLGARYEPPPPDSDTSSGIDRKAFEAVTQQRLRNMSAWALAAPEALVVLATHAGHFVHQDDPVLLVDAVRRVLFPGIPRQLRETLAAGGDVGETYRTLARRYPPERFDENLLNTLGYELLREERTDDAVAVFELNVEAYPEAANPHDSLGDGYRAAGRLDEARASYARAVELGEQTGHPSLATYRANLEQVTEQLGER